MKKTVPNPYRDLLESLCASLEKLAFAMQNVPDSYYEEDEEGDFPGSEPYFELLSERFMHLVNDLASTLRSMNPSFEKKTMLESLKSSAMRSFLSEADQETTALALMRVVEAKLSELKKPIILGL